MFISMVLLNISPTLISADKPSPKDEYIAYAINIPDDELAADVYKHQRDVTFEQQATFKILINPEHLRQTLERKSLTAVQKSQCEIITPETLAKRFFMLLMPTLYKSGKYV